MSPLHLHRAHLHRGHLLLAGLALCVGCAGCGSPQAGAAAGPTASAPVTSSASGTPAVSVTPGAGSAPTPGGPAPGTPAPGLSPVPAAVTTTRPAVALSATSTFGHRVSARVTHHEATISVAHGPGQIGGAPSVSLTVEITNGDDHALSLDAVTVTASYGDQALPATLSDGTTALHGELRAGARASGSYVFEIPVEARDAVTLTVSYTPSEPTVVFTGSVA